MYLILLLFSHPVVSNSLLSHGLQHTRPLCPSPSPIFIYFGVIFLWNKCLMCQIYKDFIALETFDSSEQNQDSEREVC